MGRATVATALNNADYRALSPKQQLYIASLISIEGEINVAAMEAAAMEAGYSKSEHTRLNTNIKVQNALISAGLPIKFSLEPLSDQALVFINEYMATFNAKVAAITAGYAHENDGIRLLKTPNVRYEIQLRQEELKNSSEISATRVLLEYAKIGFADIGDIVEVKDGMVSLKPLEEIDTSVISEISNGKFGPNVKLHSKLKSLDAMSKYLGLFKERIELTGKDGKELNMTSPADVLTRALNQMSKNKSDSSSVSNASKTSAQEKDK